MTVKELFNMILEDINGQRHVTYSDNRFATCIIEKLEEIMELANERNESLYRKISADGKISFARNKEDLPN